MTTTPPRYHSKRVFGEEIHALYERVAATPPNKFTKLVFSHFWASLQKQSEPLVLYRLAFSKLWHILLVCPVPSDVAYIAFYKFWNTLASIGVNGVRPSYRCPREKYYCSEFDLTLDALTHGEDVGYNYRNIPFNHDNYTLPMTTKPSLHFFSKVLSRVCSETVTGRSAGVSIYDLWITLRTINTNNVFLTSISLPSDFMISRYSPAYIGEDLLFHDEDDEDDDDDDNHNHNHNNNSNNNNDNNSNNNNSNNNSNTNSNNNNSGNNSNNITNTVKVSNKVAAAYMGVTPQEPRLTRRKVAELKALMSVSKKRLSLLRKMKS